jgi:predicted PurR-regulated permease PerM
MASNQSSQRKSPPSKPGQEPAKPFPVQPPPPGPEIVIPAETAAELEEEHELLHANIRAASMAQVAVAVIAGIAVFYFARVPLITVSVALLIAFILEPLVERLQKWRVPRALGALLAVVLLVAAIAAVTYLFYNRAVAFGRDLPKYSAEIHAMVAKVTSNTSKIEQNTSKVLKGPQERKPIPVQVQEGPSLFRFLEGGAGVVGDIILALSFIPFLVYFMLSWKDHAHRATVQLFPKEHRLVAHRTVGRISTMIRSFIIGNVVVGVINSVISSLVFWQLGISYPYFIGAISGFASLIPYLGVILALLPPLAGGIGVLNHTGVIMVVITVLAVHLVTMNVLYPKLVGSRVRLNPLAVTLALLFWAWVWGAMGLVLAIPIVGATKIVFDHVDSLRSLGAWLGE